MKYRFSVSAEEQERRFRARTTDSKRRWKLSPDGHRVAQPVGAEQGGYIRPPLESQTLVPERF